MESNRGVEFIYVSLLSHKVVFLQDIEYELIWSWNIDIGILIAKFGYEALTHMFLIPDILWWWYLV